MPCTFLYCLFLLLHLFLHSSSQQSMYCEPSTCQSFASFFLCSLVVGEQNEGDFCVLLILVFPCCMWLRKGRREGREEGRRGGRGGGEGRGRSQKGGEGQGGSHFVTIYFMKGSGLVSFSFPTLRFFFFSEFLNQLKFAYNHSLSNQQPLCFTFDLELGVTKISVYLKQISK